MSEDFLDALRDEPRPEFAGDLREKLRALESAPKRKRFAAGAVAAILLLAGSLAFPSVREKARAFLDLFYEREVTQIAFDPARVAPVRARLGERSPVLAVFADPERLTEAGGPSVYPTVEAAAAAAEGSLDIRVPASLPAGLVLDRVELVPPERTRLRVDADALKETLDRLDLQEVRVPRRLAEGWIEVERPLTGTLHYTGSGVSLDLSESMMPIATPSSGLDLLLLAEIGLRIVGVEAEEAHRLTKSIDWAATMTARMPAGAEAFREVAVGDAKGLLVTGSSSDERLLLWAEDGRLVMLRGTLSEDELLGLANSVGRR
jgi:hypothetical protein